MSLTTPGLRAYEISIRSDVAELVGQLRELLGAQLVAYLGSVTETRAVRQWADGVRRPPTEATRRLKSPGCSPSGTSRLWFKPGSRG